MSTFQSKLVLMMVFFLLQYYEMSCGFNLEMHKQVSLTNFNFSLIYTVRKRLKIQKNVSHQIVEVLEINQNY